MSRLASEPVLVTAATKQLIVELADEIGEEMTGRSARVTLGEVVARAVEALRKEREAAR